MTDTVKSWIEERRAIHAAAPGEAWSNYGTPPFEVYDSTKYADGDMGEVLAETRALKVSHAITDAHNMFPRTLDAIEAVLKVHRPGDVFTWAEDCADPENHHLFTDVRTGDMLCEDEPIGRFCNGCVPENDTTIDVDEYPWPCRTVRPIEEAINGE